MTRSGRNTRALPALALALALTLTAHAGLAATPEPRGEAATVAARLGPPAPAAIAGAEVRTLTTRDGKRRYRLLIGRPAGEPPPGGFPVLHLLDGNATFATAYQAMRLQSRRPDVSAVKPMVIVGIAHLDGADDDAPFDVAGRYRDYTPASPGGTPKPGPGSRTFPPSGEADRFLDFLIDEVRPAIAGLIPTDPDRQALFGHSLGGLFVLHTLATRPDAFRHLIAASPSVWWDGDRVLEELVAFDEREPARPPARTLVLVGQRELTDMRAGAATAAHQLTESPVRGMETWFEMIDHADHVTILPVAINRALRFASGEAPWPSPGPGPETPYRNRH